MGRGRTWIVAIVLAGVALVGSTTSGRQWFEDRIESIRWFINEVKTLHPSLAPR